MEQHGAEERGAPKDGQRGLGADGDPEADDGGDDDEQGGQVGVPERVALQGIDEQVGEDHGGGTCGEGPAAGEKGGAAEGEGHEGGPAR